MSDGAAPASGLARSSATEPAARSFSRLPRHVGFIPDGNRRWAECRGAVRRQGYAAGIEPGLRLLELCRDLGIEEVSIYGFTKENARRPRDQVRAFCDACVDFAERAVAAGAALQVIGDDSARVFPDSLRCYARQRSEGVIKVNLLANYGWRWDLGAPRHRSRDASRIDLVVRWGGRRRLSGFLPVQCAYADIYVVDTLWPDMHRDEFLDALRWYEKQDVTLGG
jgi:undecaprenyl diphosphate synthase